MRFVPRRTANMILPVWGCYTLAKAKRKILSKNDESMVRKRRLAESESNNNYSLELQILLLTPGDNRLVRDEPILNTTPGH